MQHHNTKKPNILFVNHDKKKVEPLISELKELVGGRDNQPFSNFFHFELEIVDIPGDLSCYPNKLNAVAIEISKKYSNEKHPSIIFVDLCMIHKVGDYRNGIGLADAIKKTFSQVPVWVYTRINWTTKALYSASKTAIDGMLTLDSPEQLADDLWDLFVSCQNIQQVNLASSIDNLFRSPSWFEIEWDGEPSDKSRFGFKSAVEALGFRVFRGYKDIGKLVFKQLKPGFSGTQLVKVTPFDRSNHSLTNIWVLKIAEHGHEIEKLRKEVEGYELVRDRIPRIFRPELYSTATHCLKYVVDNWWGAFAMSFESEFDPLIERFSEIAPDEVYSKVFGGCLKSLYGECQEFDKPINLPSDRTVTNAIGVLPKIERFREVILRSYKDYSSDMKRLSDTLPTITNKILIKTDNKPIGKGLKNIHGDLNCRNIMVKRGNNVDEFRLIDFPKVVADNLRPAATDYVKAETELLFLIMDYQSGLDIDPTRMPEWIDIFKGAEFSIGANSMNVVDEHLNTICHCIRAIRSEYKTFVGAEDSDWLQYRLLLLEYVLKCITYQDITPVKRAAACIYSKLLIDGLLK